MSKTALALLDKTCEAVSAENGTIRTHGLAYDYYVEKAIEACSNCSRAEIQAILNKYSNYGERTTGDH